MIKAIAILTDDKGKTIGASFLDGGVVKNLTTQELQIYRGLDISNAIIDINGFVKGKTGIKLKRTIYNTRPSVYEQRDRKDVNKLLSHNPITIYHGNRDKSISPSYDKGKKDTDYGIGFYCTPNKELGKEWSYSIYSHGDTHYLHSYRLDMTGLSVFDFSKVNTLHWLAELFANRKLTKTVDRRLVVYNIEDFIKKFKLDLSDYDVIIGYRADDSYFSYAEDFLSFELYLELVERVLRYGDLGLQVCIKSKKAYNQLTPLGVEEVPPQYKDYFARRDKKAREEYRRTVAESKKLKRSEMTTIADVLREDFMPTTQ